MKRYAFLKVRSRVDAATHCIQILLCLSIAAMSVAQQPFIWGEYAAQNNLKADQRLSPKSWTSLRCTIFTAGQLPASKKCQDGTPCPDQGSCIDGKPCVCNDGLRDSTRNPGFTGDGKTCNTLEPCMFNKIDESRMADCLPECTTLQRTAIVQLTADITKSCDYASNQRVLQCGNCFLKLCEFENRFNPTMLPCASKYYADIWPCYIDHYKQFCQLELPVCSSRSSELLIINGFLMLLILALALWT